MSRQIVAPTYVEPLDLLVPPVIPSLHDDEFDGVSLDPSWIRLSGSAYDDPTPIDAYAGFTATGHRTSHNSYRKSWYMVQPTAGASLAGLSKPISFATDCFIWARLSFSHRLASSVNDDSNVGLSFIVTAQAFTPRLSLFINEADNGTIQMQMDDNAIGGVATTNSVITQGQAVHTIGIQKLGTAFHAWALSAAGNWLYIASASNASAFDHAALSFGCNNSATPGNGVYGVDFFRYKVGKLLP